jgi:hypothetical protein
VLQADSKCSNTIVYAPLLNRLAPFEHIKLYNQDAKSRILRGLSNMI